MAEEKCEGDGIMTRSPLALQPFSIFYFHFCYGCEFEVINLFEFNFDFWGTPPRREMCYSIAQLSRAVRYSNNNIMQCESKRGDKPTDKGTHAPHNRALALGELVKKKIIVFHLSGKYIAFVVHCVSVCARSCAIVYNIDLKKKKKIVRFVYSFFFCSPQEINIFLLWMT